MGDKSPKSKKRDQQQKSAGKEAKAVNAKAKQDRQSSTLADSKQAKKNRG